MAKRSGWRAARSSTLSGLTSSLPREARVELGRVLAAAGRREEAAAEVSAGLALYEKKGDTILTSNARALLAELC